MLTSNANSKSLNPRRSIATSKLSAVQQNSHLSSLVLKSSAEIEQPDAKSSKTMLKIADANNSSAEPEAFDAEQRNAAPKIPDAKQCGFSLLPVGCSL